MKNILMATAFLLLAACGSDPQPTTTADAGVGADAEPADARELSGWETDVTCGFDLTCHADEFCVETNAGFGSSFSCRTLGAQCTELVASDPECGGGPRCVATEPRHVLCSP